ncbi:hypothetical protein ISCGN_027396 [Ixodes scapularis]
MDSSGLSRVIGFAHEVISDYVGEDENAWDESLDIAAPPPPSDTAMFHGIFEVQDLDYLMTEMGSSPAPPTARIMSSTTVLKKVLVTRNWCRAVPARTKSLDDLFKRLVPSKKIDSSGLSRVIGFAHEVISNYVGEDENAWDESLDIAAPPPPSITTAFHGIFEVQDVDGAMAEMGRHLDRTSKWSELRRSPAPPTARIMSATTPIMSILKKVCTWCLLIASGQTSSSSPIGYRADIAHLQLLHVANIYSAPFTGTMTSEELQEAAPPLPIKETQAAAGVSGHGNPAVMMSPNVPLLMQTYQAGWLNADAITMLASTVTNLPFGGTGGVGEEPVALGVRAMYNLELFSSAYNEDYLFTAAAIRNAYKFAYDSCLYVPCGVATAELRSLKKREVLLGVRQPTISNVVNDINNVKTSSVMVYLDGTVRKRGGGIASGGVGCLKASGLQEDVVEKIAESVESTVKTILPRLCEMIGIPSVIANAMTATKKIRLLDVLRTVDNVLFQHSDWEERINRGLAAIPSLINNITNEPIVSFVPSKMAYTHVPTGSTLELPGFDNSIVLSTHLDPETNKCFCPLKFILQEPFLYLNKGSGRYFTHSSGGHPMPFTQVEGLRILYHFLVQ